MGGEQSWQVLATRLAVTVVFVVFWLATLLYKWPTALHRVAPQKTTAAASAAGATAPAEGEPSVEYVSNIYVPGHARAHPELCPDQGAHLQLLILVTSAPSHASARDAVRLTWGHYRVRSDVAIAFVLGQIPPALEAAVDAEDELYGDLIVGNSIDSYKNLTLKTISMLEWTMKYCSRAPYLLKTDDDMFINVPRLLSHVHATGNASRTVWGRVVHEVLAVRWPQSKFFITMQEWKDPVYPDYVTGGAYLMTADCVRPLLNATVAPLRRYLFLEDVFVTGMLATELGIRRVHLPAFFNKELTEPPHPCFIRHIISVHQVCYDKQFDLWRKLLDGTTNCTNYQLNHSFEEIQV